MRRFVVAFVAGCWTLQQQSTLPPQVGLHLGAVVLALIALGMALWGRRLHVVPHGLALAGLAFGAAFCWAAWRADLRMRDWLPTTLEARDLDVRGVVSGLPADAAAGTRFAFTVEQGEAGQPLPRRVILNWRGAPPDLRPGQRLALTVRLRRPRGLANPFGFDYAYWLLAQGYGATGYVRSAQGSPQDASGERLAWRIEARRAAVRDHLRAALPKDARFGAVLIALVIGDQRGIEADNWKLFRRTGVSHLVAISGLHITMIAGMAGSLAGLLWRHSFGLGRWLRRPLPLWLPARQAALVVAVASALAYGLLAGMQIPALRTVAMLCVAAVAVWGARAPPVSVVLAWAALVALLLDPWAVMLPGFWLSFGAVAVIFFAARPGRDAVVAGRWQRLRATLATGARTQWAVTIGLVPLTLLLFGQVSVVSPLANAVAIPVVSLLVTPLALLGAALPAMLAVPVLAVAHLAMVALAAVLEWLSVLPWAMWEAASAGPLALGLAALGVGLLVAPVATARMRLRGGLLMLPMLLARGPPVAHGQFRAVMFDVGQGTAVLVRTRSHALLYDAGPAYGSGSSAGAQVVLPWLRGEGIGRLDHLMVSHEDTDHAGGVADVEAAVAVVARSTGAPVGHALLGAQAGQWAPCAAGQQWNWDGVRFTVLHPLAEDAQQSAVASNARSCVLRVDTAAHSLLLTGDIGMAQERALIDRLPAGALRADVLVVAHHGSGTSSGAAWVEAVGPSAAVFQLGHANRYRHPGAEVWERYGRARALRYRTDETGAVTMTTAPSGYALSMFRHAQARYWRARPPAPS
ncbi:DNA internalization-related competence protein ComEC/Rec2 [Cupriavidus necator]|uniref:DNA internalization-related competence protein ComEC/Rec2 n=1 Tax=Cupriavidus necator TaxID=106590 RepID=A0A1U9UL46_CUPNE|nr:DNA internalization-related competence protein ComEC/Rec2 [Cupriavidus necator]AQV93486.1 DNA internalization-related competence protein ComEC/Rec2 [Cupriavidus necator]